MFQRIDQEVGGGLISTFIFRGGQPYVGGKVFSEGGAQRSVPLYCYPTFISLTLSELTFTLCQTKFSKLQKMLLVSYKTIFCENEAVHLCVTMQKLSRAFVATIECITFSYSFADKKLRFCGGVFKDICHENEVFPEATF